MFTNIINKIKGWWTRVVNPKQVKDKLKIEPAISQPMELAIKRWYEMYTDKSEVDEEGYPIKKMVKPYTIAAEKARLVTLEMKSSVYDKNISEIDTEEQDEEQDVEIPEVETRATYLNSQYQMLLKGLRHKITPGIALGTLVFKPIPNVEDKTFTFDFVLANEFFPISFNTKNKLSEAVFIEQIIKKDESYTRFERHSLKNGVITVTNEAYKSQSQASNELGTKISLEQVAEWQHLEPSVQIKSANNVPLDRLLVAMFTMPEANNVDLKSKLGMSCFAVCEDSLKELNQLYSGLLWEFKGGELAIDAPRNTIKEKTQFITDPKTGLQREIKISVIPKREQRLFREVNLSNASGNDLYSPYNPAFREQSYLAAINRVLMKIEAEVALSRGTFSDPTIESKTATEIIMQKQKTYQSTKDIQEVLEDTLQDVVYIMDVYTSLYNLAPAGEYATSFMWDDSILTDINEELRQRSSLMAQGGLYPEEVTAWYKGITVEKRFQEIQKYNELKSKYNPEPEIEENTVIERE